MKQRIFKITGFLEILAGFVISSFKKKNLTAPNLTWLKKGNYNKIKRLQAKYYFPKNLLTLMFIRLYHHKKISIFVTSQKKVLKNYLLIKN